MLTCLEIMNILYMKCVEICQDLKFKYNSTFNDRRHRPQNYYNNNYTDCSSRYNRDVVIDIDKQLILETVNGPIFVTKNENENIIPERNLATINEKTILNTFTGELLSPVSDVSILSNESDWDVITDDSN